MRRFACLLVLLSAPAAVAQSAPRPPATPPPADDPIRQLADTTARIQEAQDKLARYVAAADPRVQGLADGLAQAVANQDKMARAVADRLKAAELLGKEQREELAKLAAGAVETNGRIAQVQTDLRVVSDGSKSSTAEMARRIDDLKRIIDRLPPPPAPPGPDGFRAFTRLGGEGWQNKAPREAWATLVAEVDGRRVPLAGRAVTVSFQVLDGGKEKYQEVVTSRGGEVRVGLPDPRTLPRGTSVVFDYPGDGRARPSTVRVQIR